jgi:LacI family transcriptional regulator
VAVTLEDIARDAGVSRSTVSLVLRDSPLVADTTRRRVREAMQRRGYHPNLLAAGLRSKRSGILGLVVSDLTYPHYAHMAVGVEEAVEAAGFSLIVANSHERPERQERHIGALRRYRADGLIITPVQWSKDDVAHLRQLRNVGYPFVTLYRDVPDLGVDHCGTDVYAAARQVVGYLAGQFGHRHIALISGPLRNSTNPARLAGWRDELAARGLPAPEELVTVTDGSREAGESATRALIERRAPVTAIVCVNDFMALGALRALHLAGKRVPDHVSVAGMGGFAEYSSPERLLTTMADDYRAIGRQAGALLLRRLNGNGAAGPDGGRPVERRLLPARLRVGETTGPCPG